eukprot:6198983-Pleurochrysis_carterae.AAC.7
MNCALLNERMYTAIHLGMYQLHTQALIHLELLVPRKHAHSDRKFAIGRPSCAMRLCSTTAPLRMGSAKHIAATCTTTTRWNAPRASTCAPATGPTLSLLYGLLASLCSTRLCSLRAERRSANARQTNSRDRLTFCTATTSRASSGGRCAVCETRVAP